MEPLPLNARRVRFHRPRRRSPSQPRARTRRTSEEPRLPVAEHRLKMSRRAAAGACSESSGGSGHSPAPLCSNVSRRGVGSAPPAALQRVRHHQRSTATTARRRSTRTAVASSVHRLESLARRHGTLPANSRRICRARLSRFPARTTDKASGRQLDLAPPVLGFRDVQSRRQHARALARIMRRCW